MYVINAFNPKRKPPESIVVMPEPGKQGINAKWKTLGASAELSFRSNHRRPKSRTSSRVWYMNCVYRNCHQNQNSGGRAWEFLIRTQNKPSVSWSFKPLNQVFLLALYLSQKGLGKLEERSLIRKYTAFSTNKI